MNRYRNAPGLHGPSKATASTLCQKCLKRGHYSYECKATTQERPYISRPSRTQQLQNPDLIPRLTSETPNDLLRTNGVADEVLATQEQERGRKRDLEDDEPRDRHYQSRKRARSISSYFSNSVSTISTSLSHSRSPKSHARHHAEDEEASYDRERRSLSVSKSRQRKRTYSESSSGYSHSSHSPIERRSLTGERDSERNTRRKRRESSPDERGRRRDLSVRGGRRKRSCSERGERSRIARERRSLTPEGRKEPALVIDQHTYQHKGQARPGRVHPSAHPPRERSLSPFSKRLALTQAMNMGRQN